MKVIELCAGAGGQALGLEMAKFDTSCLVEIEKDACGTLSLNRPNWNILNADIKQIKASDLGKADVICGGVPCQPFSMAGQQLGHQDERDLFPHAVRLVETIRPLGFFFENVRGLAGTKFDEYRNKIIIEFIKLGYHVEWRVLEAADFGVPQLRPRFILVGKRNGFAPFPWPKAKKKKVTLVDSISDLLGENGWRGLSRWQRLADCVAPTIVGGSKKHGGPDLGPTRAKKQWADLGIDGMGIANEPPLKSFVGNPRLTNKMVARIQGFPDSWQFYGSKTSVYRQLGNAFPPPVAKAVALAMAEWLTVATRKRPSFERFVELSSL